MRAQQLVEPGVFQRVEVSEADERRPPAGRGHLARLGRGHLRQRPAVFAGRVSSVIDGEASLAANIPGYPMHEVVGEVIVSDDPAIPVGGRAVGLGTRFTGLAANAPSHGPAICSSLPMTGPTLKR